MNGVKMNGNDASNFRVHTWDAAGFSASLLCALHCALTPLFVSVLPLIGLEFLAHPVFETAMIALSLIIGAAALRNGYLNHHHKASALLVFALGAILLLVARNVLSDPFAEWTTLLGLAVIASSHFINWRLCQRAHCCASSEL